MQASFCLVITVPLKNNFTFLTPIHPARLRFEARNNPDILVFPGRTDRPPQLPEL